MDEQIKAIEKRILILNVSESAHEKRLDMAVAILEPSISRSFAQKLIKAGLITVDGKKRPQSYRVNLGSVIKIEIPIQEIKPKPELGDLDVIYEDDEILVINKKPGLVVHPGAGHMSGTIVNMLLGSSRTLSMLGGEERAGLVHRLDKDTSGVLVIAKTDFAHQTLSAQFKRREIRKEYLAIVLGSSIPDRGEIKSLFGRRGGDRRLFTGRVREGRDAVTEYQCIARAKLSALIKVIPKTGRTHQIRVHLSEFGHPVLGDRVYGRGYPKPGSTPLKEAETLREIKRQALHAWKISLIHPRNQEMIEFKAEIPKDMKDIIEKVFGITSL